MSECDGKEQKRRSEKRNEKWCVHPKGDNASDTPRRQTHWHSRKAAKWTRRWTTAGKKTNHFPKSSVTPARPVWFLHVSLSSTLPGYVKTPTTLRNTLNRENVIMWWLLGYFDHSASLGVPLGSLPSHFSVIASLFHINREERVEDIASKTTNQKAPWKFSLCLSIKTQPVISRKALKNTLMWREGRWRHLSLRQAAP